MAPGTTPHATGLLEYPHYTRPPEFRGWTVPEILLSGDHGKIARWRREQALLRTWLRRPDLLAKADLSPKDRQFLAGLELPRRPDRFPQPCCPCNRSRFAMITPASQYR